MFVQPAPTPEIIRTAGSRDFSALTNFFSSMAIAHRHLDWKPPVEWLGSSPFLVAETGDQILGVLICPPLQKGLVWIRYFGSKDWHHPERIWLPLWQKATTHFAEMNINLVATLSLHDWFDNILQRSGFEFHQHIINLDWTDQPIQTRIMPERVQIREMTQSDLTSVLMIDQQAFEDIWRYSLDELSLAFGQSAFSTVAVSDNHIIGYQMSTVNGLTCHLARLAVSSHFRGKNIGFNLVSHLLSQMNSRGIWRVTVNTQSTNQASLSLYHQLGFMNTDGNIPVYTCTL